MGFKLIKDPLFLLMPYQPDIEAIKDAIQPILQDSQVELIDIIYRFENGRNVLRLLVDKAGGISMDVCAGLNRKIGDFLEQTDLIRQSFVLEVNSPGLDRPIVTKSDFAKNTGKSIRMIVRNQKGTTDVVVGVLKSVEENVMVFEVNGVELKIASGDVIKARLEI